MTNEKFYNSTKSIIKKITTRSCTPICGAEDRKAYRRRKAVKKHTSIMVALTLILIICMGSMLFAFAKEPAEAPAQHTSITVLNGDSLWSIAKDYFPDNDPRDVIDEIRSLNDIDGYTIYAGQALILPDCI